MATKQGESRKMKHIHTRFLFIQDLVFRKLLTMSSVKTDGSDFGTKALGRERFYGLRSILGMGTELTETSSPGKWYSGDESASHWIRVWWIGRVERWTHVRSVDFGKYSVQRGTPLESDTASRREEACLLNTCYVVAQMVTSQRDTADTTVTFFSYTDVLGPSRIT